jgi:hypothetical protein
MAARKNLLVVPAAAVQAAVAQATTRLEAKAPKDNSIPMRKTQLRKVICRDVATQFFKMCAINQDPLQRAEVTRNGATVVVPPNADSAFTLIKCKGTNDIEPGGERFFIMSELNSHFRRGMPSFQIDVIDPPLGELATDGRVMPAMYERYLAQLRTRPLPCIPHRISIEDVIDARFPAPIESLMPPPRVVVPSILDTPPTVVGEGEPMVEEEPRHEASAVISITAPAAVPEVAASAPSSPKRPAPANPVIPEERPKKRCRRTSEEEDRAYDEYQKALRSHTDKLQEKEASMNGISEQIKELMKAIELQRTKMQKVEAEHDEIAKSLKETQAAAQEIDRCRVKCCLCSEPTSKSCAITLSAHCGHICCADCFDTKIKSEFEKVRSESAELVECPGCAAHVPCGTVDEYMASILTEESKGKLDPFYCKNLAEKLQLDSALVGDLSEYQASFFQFIASNPPAGTYARKTICPHCQHENFGMTNYKLKVARCTKCLDVYCTLCHSSAPYHFGRGCDSK